MYITQICIRFALLLQSIDYIFVYKGILHLFMWLDSLIQVCWDISCIYIESAVGHNNTILYTLPIIYIPACRVRIVNGRLSFFHHIHNRWKIVFILFYTSSHKMIGVFAILLFVVKDGKEAKKVAATYTGVFWMFASAMDLMLRWFIYTYT